MFGLHLNYRAFLKKLVTDLLEKPWIHILLVPHNFAPLGNIESDTEACTEVLQTVPEAKRHRVHLVTGEYDQHEIKGIIGDCDFFIGSRMHSCIAALSQGVPAIGVAYSKKFKGVFDSIDVGDWIVDGRETSEATAVDIILQWIDRRNEMRAALAGKSARAQALVRETFSRLFASLTSPQIDRSIQQNLTHTKVAHSPRNTEGTQPDLSFMMDLDVKK